MAEGAEAAALGFRFFLAFVLLVASLPKLFAPAEFARVVANYGLLPEPAAQRVARWLPWLELLCAAALLAGTFVRVAAAGTAILLTAFGGAVALNLLRGRAINCGCFSSVAPNRIAWPLVAKDAVLAAMAIALAIIAPSRLAVDALWHSADRSALTRSDAVAIVLLSGVVALAGRATAAAARLHDAVRRYSAASAGEP
jgi:uncharacterized membrane protein YphA (DoxX/SURF4 family)